MANRLRIFFRNFHRNYFSEFLGLIFHLEIFFKVLILFLSGSFAYFLIFCTSVIGIFFSWEDYYQWCLFPLIIFPKAYFTFSQKPKLLRGIILDTISVFIPAGVLVYLFKYDVDNTLISKISAFDFKVFIFVSVFPILYLLPEISIKLKVYFRNQKEQYDDCILMTSACLGLNYGFEYFLFIVIIISNKFLIIKFSELLYCLCPFSKKIT